MFYRCPAGFIKWTSVWGLMVARRSQMDTLWAKTLERQQRRANKQSCHPRSPAGNREAFRKWENSCCSWNLCFLCELRRPETASGSEVTLPTGYRWNCTGDSEWQRLTSSRQEFSHVFLFQFVPLYTLQGISWWCPKCFLRRAINETCMRAVGRKLNVPNYI